MRAVTSRAAARTPVGPRLAVRDLTVDVDGATLLHGVSVEVAARRWLAVVGPNGAGKSTLLRAAAGLAPHRGEVLVDGVPLGALGLRERARRIAYAPQSPVLPPDFAVFDYVLLGRTPHLGYLAREGRRDRAAAHDALARLDLTGLAGRRLASLSGGERQRVVLARALAQQADVLLLDEPTTALDLGHQQQVLELVDGLRRSDGLTVVTALHDLTLAAQYADEVLLLAAGRAAAAGHPAAVLTAETIRAHYGARVRVVPDERGRPTVHLTRPPRDGDDAP